MCWVAYEVKRSKVKVTASNDSESRVNNISPKLGDYVPGPATYWLGQKVTDQGHNRKGQPKYNIFVNIWANFTRIRSRMYLGRRHTDYVKDQTSRSRQADHTVFPVPMKAIYPIYPQMYLNVFADMLINFRGQKVEGEGQGHHRQWPVKPGKYTIFVSRPLFEFHQH